MVRLFNLPSCGQQAGAGQDEIFLLQPIDGNSSILIVFSVYLEAVPVGLEPVALLSIFNKLWSGAFAGT